MDPKSSNNHNPTFSDKISTEVPLSEDKKIYFVFKLNPKKSPPLIFDVDFRVVSNRFSF